MNATILKANTLTVMDKAQLTVAHAGIERLLGRLLFQNPVAHLYLLFAGGNIVGIVVGVIVLQLWFVQLMIVTFTSFG